MNDPEDVKERKMNKVLLLQIIFAVFGFHDTHSDDRN